MKIPAAATHYAFTNEGYRLASQKAIQTGDPYATKVKAIFEGMLDRGELEDWWENIDKLIILRNAFDTIWDDLAPSRQKAQRNSRYRSKQHQ